jgi:DNA-directed RNA polymerase specialized sigma24 family protein
MGFAGETFEQLVSSRLSALYAGARFLAAGSEGAAEELLADGLVKASSRFGTWAWDPAGLERALVEEAVAGWRGALPGWKDTQPAPLPDALANQLPPAVDVAAMLESAPIDSFYRAAVALPPRARAAIWLVVLERWTYDDVAKLLKVDREELLHLLSWRQVLLDSVLADTRMGRALKRSR